MTLLLFLASVAVLEYLVRDVRHKSGGMPQSSEIDNAVNCNQMVSHETSTTDLLSLGKALEAQKTGKVADAEHAVSKEAAVR